MSAFDFALLFFIGFLVGFLSRIMYARMTGKLRAEDFKNPKNVRYIETKPEQDTKKHEEEPERKVG